VVGSILDTAHEAFVSMDAGGFVVDWNPEAERTFGWTREEALGRVLADTIIPLKLRDAHWRGLERLAATGEGPVLNKRIEITALHREGYEFPIELTISATPSDQGQTFHAFLHDVSERKQRQEELEKSQRQLAQAQRLAGIGSWEWDVETDELSWSDELSRIFGLEPGISTGGYSEFLDRVHPDDRALVDQAVKGALCDCDPFEVEHRIIRPDGTTRILQGRGEVSTDEDGKPVKIAGTGHDITDRRRLEEATRWTQERYCVLVESVADYAIYMLDPSGRVVSWSRGAEEIKGYGAYEILGQHFSVFFEPSDVEDGRPERNLEQAAEHGRYEDEGWRVRKDGSRFWATAVLTALRAEDGRLQGFSKVTRDITERKRAGDEALLARELALAVGEAETPDEALARTVRKICEETGWALGQVWIVNPNNDHLDCSTAWYATSDGLEPFRSRSESLTFERSVGLPGTAWATAQPVWMRDVRSAPNVVRAQFAREVGLGAGMAVPVLAKEEVVAVLEFFLLEPRDEDEALINLVSAAASHLGTLIQRKEAESELKASEALFRSLVESVDDYAIFMLDPEGHVASWNQGAERITGYRSGEIMGYHFSHFYSPEARADGQPERHLEEAMKGGRYEESDWRVRKDGLLFRSNLVLTALYDDEGHIHGFSHVVRDVTERKQIEEELHRLGSIVEHSDDAIFSTTPGRGIITSWNAGAERLFGHSSREMVGRRDSLIFPPAQKEEQTRIFEQVLEGKRAHHYETRSLRKDGSFVDVSLTVSPIKDVSGAITGVSTIARDITEVKRARQYLEEAFGTYVDREIATHILEEGPSLAGEEVEVTAMFIDVCRFTNFMERMEPPEVVATLNELFEQVVPIVTDHAGHVDKFTGDGLLAVFGTPRPEPDHASQALDAAIEIERAVRSRFGRKIRIGIGIESGSVIAGNVGGGGRLDFTVIGDAVNTAAHVEAATRHTGDTILLTERTRNLLRSPSGSLVKRPGIRLKGRREPVDLFAPTP
jgi:PAS domain S-box-containing protein